MPYHESLPLDDFDYLYADHSVCKCHPACNSIKYKIEINESLNRLTKFNKTWVYNKNIWHRKISTIFILFSQRRRTHDVSVSLQRQRVLCTVAVSTVQARRLSLVCWWHFGVVCRNFRTVDRRAVLLLHAQTCEWCREIFKRDLGRLFKRRRFLVLWCLFVLLFISFFNKNFISFFIFFK
jgi:hypothetical protein